MKQVIPVRLLAGAAALVLGAALLTGCGDADAPSGVTPAASTGAVLAPLTIDITESQGKVTPSGQKIDVTVGQTVRLTVTSDADDEIHAHTGGDGYELEVKAGQPATGEFVLSSPGSFEVESHELEQVIVVLNARQ
jgi:FtsP/CotA-like multicopper oxidase with cupredoxin domain